MRRNYPPGVHGPAKQHVRLSEYGRELREKQEVKIRYGVDQVKPLKELESRLDNVVFRLGFAPSRAAAKQFISHGHVTVNDQSIKISSYKVRKDDVVKLVKRKLAPNLKNFTPPKWLRLNKSQLKGTVVGGPEATINN